MIPLSINGDPDIYISKTEDQPSYTPDMYDWSCNSFGKDTCLIPAIKLKQGDILHIGVTCRNKNCMYSLHTSIVEKTNIEEK